MGYNISLSNDGHAYSNKIHVSVYCRHTMYELRFKQRALHNKGIVDRSDIKGVSENVDLFFKLL